MAPNCARQIAKAGAGYVPVVRVGKLGVQRDIIDAKTQ
jgi:hypothetical protein